MNPARLGQPLSFLPSVLLAGLLVSTNVAAQSDVTQSDATQSAGEAGKPQTAATGANGKSKSDAGDVEAKGWKSLKGSWVVSQFGGDGPVEIDDNLIKFGFGDPLTGIRWEGELFRENYEIELQARRTDGFDFFCGLTFPVGEDNVSFILGGWGGGVVGLSSIDGRDASENDTTSFRNFDNETWYKVRVRVDPYEIRCWIDDKEVCSHPRLGHEFDIRYEMDQCVPLGLAAFQCKSELRHLRLRKLSEEEVAKATKKLEQAKK